ncbi:MarR family winged helix-turn-helix transcriptional regulator [Pediococcus ethanolidurans]|uniref:MarR family winged helix-turn-helix transcriptional regulator n=1 Tax=Pediococcus ethanolidurans TaxID=319653 RepID=UPI0021E71B55|nr:MarR family winged helix-turn-helix transcriptional regulator [Pediococcus ethanolidurans]MCV3315247.1 MarR family winged helix-turn-helix transcriptional regulator [Pediococcus ethanolidurans]
MPKDLSKYGQLVKHANNTLRRHIDTFAAGYGLTGVQLSIIDFLGKYPQQMCLQRDIETEFAIRRSSATTLLQRMEKKGLILRLVAKDDARQKEIQLTKKVQPFVQLNRDYMKAQRDSLETNFSQEELLTFTKVLQFLIIDEVGKNYGKERER